MAEARSRDNWAHTSTLLAMLFNLNRDPKKTLARKPADFDPYHVKKRSVPKVDIDILKTVFVDGKARDVLKGTQA